MYKIFQFEQQLVADPGSPQGGPTPQGGGRQHTYFPKFPKNFMKSKEFGHPLGVGGRGDVVVATFGSANGSFDIMEFFK